MKFHDFKTYIFPTISGHVMMTRTLKFPSSSNWRPPGSFLLLLGGILINCIISPTVSLPFKEGKTIVVVVLPTSLKAKLLLIF